MQAASAEDVDKAVKAAHAALKTGPWKTLPGTERGILMNRLADLMEKNKELLATIDTWDNGEPDTEKPGRTACSLLNLTCRPGKPYKDALEGDLPEAIGTIRYYAGWADKIFGQTISTTSEKFAYTVRQPIGVVGQIIPWNYPLSMACWKLGPALACGNTVVLKAAEQTPLSILVLGQLIREAGFPPGVVNLINGYGKEAGVALVEHPQVDKIAFTGSTSTARHIMTLAAKSLKNITLETGGKSPLLVFDDADLDQAVKWSHFGIMSNKGEICTATSRILVHKPIYASFVEAFQQRVASTSVLGNPFDEATYQGPQVTKQQQERVKAFIDSAVSEGATLMTGGQKDLPGGKGYFVRPTVLTDVSDSMTVFREEIFGPVVVISTFETEEEAVARANSTAYGLGAAVFTRDLEKAHRVAGDIEAGMVWVNSSQDCDPRIPFGGVKQSGIGRELGEAGLEAYTQIKAVHINMGNRL